jgi:hypothetical protein
MSEDEFRAAINKIMGTFFPTAQNPFPLIAHFRVAAGTDGETRITLAVMAVKEAAGSPGAYSSVDFGDRALHAVINSFGGWPHVASWSVDDWKYNEKNFTAAYRALMGSNEGPDKLIGIFEGENSLKSTKGWTDAQIQYAERQKRPIKIGWSGYTETRRIENKNHPEKLIDDLTKGIGNVTRKR